MTRDVLFVPLALGAEGGLTIDARMLGEELTRRGNRVTLVGVGRPGPTFAGSRLEVVSLPTRAPACVAHRLNLAGGFPRLLATRERPIVHLFSVLPSYLHFAAAAAARRRGVPVVWTTMLHPLRRRVWERRPLLRVMPLFDAAAARAVAQLADVVAVATEEEAVIFRRLAARRVAFIPPPVDGTPPRPQADAAALRSRLAPGRGPLAVAVVSRPEPRKGLPFALESLAALRRRVPAARLLVLGMGAGERAEGVIYAGRVTDDELALALRAADVVFVPSLFEAFSRVVVEAWSQEARLVVTDGVALAPLVAKAGGRIVPYGDAGAAAEALAAALDDENGAGARGRALADERFTLARVASDAEAVYDTVLARNLR